VAFYNRVEDTRTRGGGFVPVAGCLASSMHLLFFSEKDPRKFQLIMLCYPKFPSVCLSNKSTEVSAKKSLEEREGWLVSIYYVLADVVLLFAFVVFTEAF